LEKLVWSAIAAILGGRGCCTGETTGVVSTVSRKPGALGLKGLKGES